MAPKSMRKAICDALDDLVDDDLKRFCFQLPDRKGKRVKRSLVSGKSREEITDVLVRTYTEKGALKVVLETLREAGFNQNAKDLVKATKHLTSSTRNTRSKSKASGASGAAPSEPDMADKHFIDKHRKELINGVSNIDGILDDLLDVGAINQETYDKIRAKSTTQEKMRELYSGPLKAEGCKDAFYDSLEENEKFLMHELKKK